MIWSAIYNQKTSRLSCISELNEYIIEYNPKDTTLPTFIERNSNKRIVLKIMQDEDIDLILFKALQGKYENLYFNLGQYNAEKLAEAAEIGLRFFFSDTANNWDIFMGLVDCGVTDIYISDDLGFELKQVSKIAKNENIKIRVFPHIAQSQWENTEDIKKFFIRPEDINFYTPYVDVFEFYGVENKLDIYFKIYTKDKKWFGKLNEIIFNLHSDLDSRFIMPEFSKQRVDCGKVCQKGGHCRVCYRLYSLSRAFENKDLIIKIKEDENNG